MNEPLVMHLHGPLGERFGKVHRRYVNSPAEFVRALCKTHHGFREAIDRDDAPYHMYVGNTDIGPNDLAMHVTGAELHLVPAVGAAKSDGAQIVIGAIIIAAAIYTGNYAAAVEEGAKMTAGQVAAGYASNIMFAVGSSMVLGGIAQMLAPSPSVNKDKDNEKESGSAIYSGAVNTVGQNHPIQILLGESEIGSAVLASMVSNTNVSVIGSKDGSRGIHIDTMVEQYTYLPGTEDDYGTTPGDYFPASQTSISSAVSLGVGLDTASKETLYSGGISKTNNIAAAMTLVTSGGTLIAADALPVLRQDFSTTPLAQLKPGDTLLGGTTVTSLTRVVMQPLITPVLISLAYLPEDRRTNNGHVPAPFQWPDRMVYWANGVPVKPEHAK